MTHAHTLILGEFSTAHSSVEAITSLRQKGFEELELYSPYPVPEAYEALSLKRSPMALIMLIGGLTGTASAILLQWFCNAYDYPIIIGGKPMVSWPAYVPICFELTVLFASLSGFFGLWALIGLPRPYHPVFEVPHFGSSSIDGFWVSIAAEENELEVARAKAALEGLGAKKVDTVRAEADE
jgi:Protein of unknown function (DUF3341)